MLTLFRLKNIYELLLNSYSNPRNFDEKKASEILRVAINFELTIGIFFAASYLCIELLNANIFANYHEAILNNILEGYLSENGYDLNITHREMFGYFSDLESGTLSVESFAQILENNCSLS